MYTIKDFSTRSMILKCQFMNLEILICYFKIKRQQQPEEEKKQNKYVFSSVPVCS